MTLFSMDNALSNFYGQWSSFSVRVGLITYNITCDVYLTTDTYIDWIND